MIIQIIQLTDQQVTGCRFRQQAGTLIPITGFCLPYQGHTELAGLLSANLPPLSEDLRTVLALPPQLISLRELQLPISDRIKLRQVLALELSSDSPDEAIEIVADALPLAGEQRWLAGWADRSVVAELINLLATTGMEPEVVTCHSLCWQYLAPESEQPITLLDDNCLTVISQGQLLFSRITPGAAALHCQRTLTSLELTHGIRSDQQYWLDYPEVSSLPGLPLPAELCCLPSQGDLKPEALISCLAIARAFQSGQIFNLRSGALAWKGTHNRLFKAFRLPMILGILTILLLFGEAGLRWYLLHKDITAINTSINQIYKGIFPTRSKAVDETGEVKSEIRRLQGDAAACNLLGFLHLLAQSKDDQINGFSEVEYDAERFRLKGDSRSNPAVSGLAQKLTAAGLQVDQPELTSRPDGSVLFTIKGRSKGGKP